MELVQNREEEYLWRLVEYRDPKQILPCARWGHCCCLIDHQMIIFGGYDGSYKNDFWSFNTLRLEWNIIKTTGDIPKQRSNCTINYDDTTGNIILYGGKLAPPNTNNNVSLLSWKTKEWIEIALNGNQVPEQRKYHTAEFLFPYLIVFGGEGLVAELGDLWAFDIINHTWTQITQSNMAIKPRPRKFHTSVLVDSVMYIIGGCHTKYDPLDDFYSIDLSPLAQDNKFILNWNKVQLKNNYVARWGHTSTLKDNNIYIFGGRYSGTTSNCIQMLNLNNRTITNLEIGNQPSARRRHTAIFINNLFVIFGGFNGQYNNQFYYVKLSQYSLKNELQQHLTLEEDFQQTDILSNLSTIYEGETQIIQSLVGSKSQITKVLSMSLEKRQKYLKLIYLGCSDADEYDMAPQAYLKRLQKHLGFYLQSQQGLLTVENHQFMNLMMKNEHPFRKIESNVEFILDDQTTIKANRQWLSIRCQYFYNLLSGQFQESNVSLKIQWTSALVFRVLIRYLELDFVILNTDFNLEMLMELAEIGKYLDLPRLFKICVYTISHHKSYPYERIRGFLVKYNIEYNMNTGEHKGESLVCRNQSKFERLQRMVHQFRLDPKNQNKIADIL